MTWESWAWSWLIRAALSGLVTLTVGVCAAWLCRQPVRRLRLLQLTAIGCFLVPAVAALPGFVEVPSRFHLFGAALEVAPEWVGGGQELPASTPANEVERGEAQRPEGPLVGLPGQLIQDAQATGPRGPARWPVVFAAVALGVNAVLFVLLVLSWSVGLLAIRRLRRGSRPAPEALNRLFGEITGGGGEGVSLLVNDQIEGPLTFGWRRPFVVVPGSLCQVEHRPELRYALAHEWSHVERGDVRTWHLATAIQFLFAYHPLAWWLCWQVRLCQDFLADARAADEAPSAAEYATFLIDFAESLRRDRAVAGLGLGGRRSQLFRRVVRLLQRHEALERSCPRRWNAQVTLAACAVVLIAGGLRPQGPPPAVVPQSSASQAAAGETDRVPSPGTLALTYTGTVRDIKSGQPLEGATVHVRVFRVEDARRRVLSETAHRTDSRGEYRLSIRPAWAADPGVFLLCSASHPTHAPLNRPPRSLARIWKNESLGQRPFFQELRMRPGREVSGRLRTPDGRPAAGVHLAGFVEAKQSARVSRLEGETDDQGRFHLMTSAVGRRAFLLAYPERHAPLRIEIDQRRGDLGEFTLQPGLTLRGRILDDDGQPLADQWVMADEVSDVAPGPPPWARARMQRTTRSDSNGRFVFAPLAPATYKVRPVERVREGPDHDQRQPLPAAYLPLTVSLVAGSVTEPLELRAAPTVVVEARVVDSQGRPREGSDVHLSGGMGEGNWLGRGRSGLEGRVAIKAPRGLGLAHLFARANEHTALRLQAAPDAPATKKRFLALGTLDHDVRGIVIRRHDAPIVRVKVSAPGGGTLSGVRVRADYRESEPGLCESPTGDLSFEVQPDGRWRTRQMLPDEDVIFTATADGYQAPAEVVRMPEGAVGDLELVLVPIHAGGSPHDSDPEPPGTRDLRATAVPPTGGEPGPLEKPGL